MANGDITVQNTVSGTTTAGTTIKGFSNTKVYSSIASVSEFEYLAPTTVSTALTIAAALAANTITTLNFFIVKNLDSANFITVGLMSASDSSYHKVPAGCCFQVVTTGQDTNTDGGVLSTIIAFTSISIKADTAACKVAGLAF